MTKTDLRKQMRATLAAIPVEQWRRRSEALFEHLRALPEYRRARAVMIFVTMANEIDMRPIADDLFARAVTVLVPCVDWKTPRMHAVQIHSLDSDVTCDGRGVPTPIQKREFPIESIDFVCVPGLAFDTMGNRLGRGGGFYDRFLADPRLCAMRCALALDEQIVPAIPTLPHDARVQMIVTDTSIHRCIP